MERAKRIELSSQPWQGRVLPLNHARKNQSDYLYSIAHLTGTHKCYFKVTGPSKVEAMGFK